MPPLCLVCNPLFPHPSPTAQIADATEIPPAELKRALQSLACVKGKNVLRKEPMSKVGVHAVFVLLYGVMGLTTPDHPAVVFTAGLSLYPPEHPVNLCSL